MKNKKKLLFLLPVLAIIIFVVLYIVFKYSEPNVLDSKDKEWISQNGGKIVDIAVVNNIPLYGSDGKGLVFDYLDYVTQESTIEFNKIPYLIGGEPGNAEYQIEIIDGDVNLTKNQLLIYEDNYVAIGKKNEILDLFSDLKGQTIGVLTTDSSMINYYLKGLSTVVIKNYDTIENLFTALDESEINLVVVPNVMNLDKTINNKYYVNYFFNEISKKVVLTLSDKNNEMNTIFKKTYNRWLEEEYTDDYNELLLNYYLKENNINDKTRADLLSKTYVYGYVDTPPYEFSKSSKMYGIAIEYMNRIVRLTDIDITYREYKDYKELKQAIEKGDVDIYFDYVNIKDSGYLQTKSVFSEEYVVLGNNEVAINSLESLKNKNVNMFSGNYLLSFVKDNSMANIHEYTKVSDLLKDDNLIIVDKEIYNYYKNSTFKDLTVLYDDYMTNEYSFMIKSTNDSFYKLFDFIINTNSYFNYRREAYKSFDDSIFSNVSFEELYLIILGIILVPIIIVVGILLLIKNKHRINILKRDDRKKFTDMLTSLKNRNYLNLNIPKWNENKTYPQAIVIIDLNNTKYVNDNYGREKGDNLIVKAASILVNAQLENSEIIRSDGNEFLIYMIGYNENQVEVYTKKLSKSLKDLPYGFGAAIGYSMITDNIKTIDDAINEATLDMESDKESNK
jgi:diguanylate cyclase (GGDEF)-like protein